MKSFFLDNYSCFKILSKKPEYLIGDNTIWIFQDKLTVVIFKLQFQKDSTKIRYDLFFSKIGNLPLDLNYSDHDIKHLDIRRSNLQKKSLLNEAVIYPTLFGNENSWFDLTEPSYQRMELAYTSSKSEKILELIFGNKMIWMEDESFRSWTRIRSVTESDFSNDDIINAVNPVISELIKITREKYIPYLKSNFPIDFQ
jgi:hypothetical protein